MREIKFRYRYTNGKEWIFKYFTLSEIVNGEPFETLSDMPLYRDYKHVGEDEYTGLKDKNSTEIYEGDVLKHTVDDRLFNWLVVFKNGCFGVQNIGINGFISWNEFYPINGESFFIDREIVGNKHQHPNLLQ